MKCIYMILTSNYSESCNRIVLSKNLIFQGRKVKNFWMASAACGILWEADPGAFLRRANSRKKFYYSSYQMKCISIMLTSNCLKSCNRNVWSKNLGFRGHKLKNSGMSSSSLVTSHDADLFFFVLQFPVIEEYFFKLPLKLIFNTIHDFAYIHIS